MRGSARPSILVLALALGSFASACAPHAPPGAPAPGRPARAPATLPAIPAANGPLHIDVVAPGEGEAMPGRDSTFVYGSLGTGQATLTINGTPVRVEPNGAFLAWLPIPENGAYRLQAGANGQTATLERHVRIPPALTPLPRDRPRILEGTVYPSGVWVVQPGERIDVGLRGTPGGRAWLVLPDGTRIPLVEAAAVQEAVQGSAEFGGVDAAAARALPGISSYGGFFIAQPLLSSEAGAAPRLAAVTSTVVVPPPDTSQPNTPLEAAAAARREEARAAALRRAARAPGAATLELVAAGGTDTARMALPLTVVVLARPRVGVAAPPTEADETHRTALVGRASPSGPYNWFWPAGTRLALTGERGGMYRVGLGDRRSAWVSAAEVRLLPEGAPPPYSRVGTVRLTPQAGWIDARIALSQRLPFRVDETPASLTVTLYGGQSDTDFMQYGPSDPLIRLVEWRQEADSLYTLTVNLTQSVWGYQAFFTPGGDLVLRIRRPPRIDPQHPLRGLKIALDPGHPPGGATGPTRYAEADANLGIALQLRPLLEREGATVVMTRSANQAVPLNQRPQMATDANADILLSIHNNGLPNGVNPFGNTGTSDYYFHPQSVLLAQDLEREISSELGTLDLGVGRADLALVRATWMPAVLTETMYLMVPQQEAALRNPAVQLRIAQAHLRGLLQFLRTRAREQAR